MLTYRGAGLDKCPLVADYQYEHYRNVSDRIEAPAQLCRQAKGGGCASPARRQTDQRYTQSYCSIWFGVCICNWRTCNEPCHTGARNKHPGSNRPAPELTGTVHYHPCGFDLHGSRVGLNVAGWASANSEADIVRHELDLFSQANPCISVYYHPILGNFQQKIQTEFASGDEPDVFYVSPDMIYNESKAGKLLDSTPYLSKDGFNLGAEIPALLKTFQLNGKTYGLPKDWATLGVFYNKGIFDAKKVPYPTNNMTYDDLRVLAEKVYTAGSTSATTTYGIMMPSDLGRFNAFMYGFGSNVFDPVTNKILFNNAKAVAALNYYTSFQLTDKSGTIPGTVGDAGRRSLARARLPW